MSISEAERARRERIVRRATPAIVGAVTLCVLGVAALVRWLSGSSTWALLAGVGTSAGITVVGIIVIGVVRGRQPR